MLQETNNEVTLEVDRKANKLEIKQAVEQLFGKTSLAVRTCQLRRQSPSASAVPTPAAPTTGKKPSSASRKANRSISSKRFTR